MKKIRSWFGLFFGQICMLVKLAVTHKILIRIAYFVTSGLKKTKLKTSKNILKIW